MSYYVVLCFVLLSGLVLCCVMLRCLVLCCVVVLCRYVVLCYVALSCVVLYCWIGWLSSVSLVSLIWFALAGYSHTGTAVQCCIEIVIFLHACCTGTRQWSQLQACDRVDTLRLNIEKQAVCFCYLKLGEVRIIYCGFGWLLSVHHYQ